MLEGLHGLAVLHQRQKPASALSAGRRSQSTPVVAQLAGVAARHAATRRKGPGRDALAPQAQAVDGVIGRMGFMGRGSGDVLGGRKGADCGRGALCGKARIIG